MNYFENFVVTYGFICLRMERSMAGSFDCHIEPSVYIKGETL
jgi:hypothetical protein